MIERYIGLMSGTSLDAIDAVLLEIDADNPPQITHTHSEAPDPDLRAMLLAATTNATPVSLAELGQLNQRMGVWFAHAANTIIAKSGMPVNRIHALGSHGQTLYHAPDAPHPFSWQLGDPSIIAAHTGVTTVADFRQADIAMGGQGAPLVPAFHHAVFSDASESRCIVNIGGIANITVLPAPGDRAHVIGFDTGPGNALLDGWIEKQLGHTQDTDGRWAASGEIDTELLSQLKADAFFQRPPPKSTGREQFNLAWLDQQLEQLDHAVNPADVQRTLVELTATTIAGAIRRHAPRIPRVLLCGGGAHNPLIRRQLSAHLPDCVVADTGDYGIHVDWVEAAAFAWLAMRTRHGLSGNVPAVTGARKEVVLGGLYDPRTRA